MANVIALIWDFDKTLVNGYMQDPIFEDFNVDASTFWHEVNSMEKTIFDEQNVKINPDTAYLTQFIEEAQAGGKFDGLNNAKLREYGAMQKFYAGIPEIFDKTIHMFDNDEIAKEYNIKVEHYIISTGFAEVVKGCILNNYTKQIWGCEIIEKEIEGIKRLYQIGYTIDNTTKTRGIFEINKGVGIIEGANVNSKMSNEQRRVPFTNMIYIADGPSDVPAFSVVKGKGGFTFAIYPKGNEKAFCQVEQLREDGRIDMFAEADYSEGTTAYMWITNKIKQIYERIKTEEQDRRRVLSSGPKHLV